LLPAQRSLTAPPRHTVRIDDLLARSRREDEADNKRQIALLCFTLSLSHLINASFFDDGQEVHLVEWHLMLGAQTGMPNVESRLAKPWKARLAELGLASRSSTVTRWAAQQVQPQYGSVYFNH
jgi:hypothetical protein